MSKSTRIPKLRFHKPSGRAVVTIGERDIYVGKYGTVAAQREYERVVGKWLQGGQPATKKSDSSSVAELCLAYLKHAKEYYRAPDGKPTRSIERVKIAIKHLRKKFGDTPVADFGPLALQVMQRHFVDQGFARSYCNKLTDAVRRIFKWGVSREIVSADQFQSLRTVSGLRKGRTKAPEAARKTAVDDAIVDATLPHLPPAVHDMVRVQRLLGCRPQEIVLMRPVDIARTEDVWLYRPSRHKTAWADKERVIAIGPKAQAILISYMDREPESYCFSPAESEHLRHLDMRRKRKTRVQPSQQGNARRKRKPKRRPMRGYSVAAYGKAISRACKAYGIPHWTPNQLRKTAATKIRELFDLESAKAALGHHESTTTEKFYATADLLKASEVARKMG